MQRESKSIALIATGLFGTAFVLPALSLSLLPYSSLFLERKGSGTRAFLLYAMFIAFLLAMLNAGKLVEADEGNYFFMFDQMLKGGNLGLFEAINNATGRLEILFYAVSYLVFGVLGLSFKAVTIFWTFFAYFVSACSFLIVFKGRIHRIYALAVFTFCVIFFINFALTAQVMRQYAAGSLVLLAFACFDKKARSLILIFLAALIHNSALIFVIPWCFAVYFHLRANKVPSLMGSLLIMGILTGFAYFLGDFLFAYLGNVSGSVEQLYNSSLKDDGDLTLFKIASIALAIIVLFYEVKAQDRGELNPNALPMLFAVLFLGVLLIVVRQLPLLLLRFSFYSDFFSFIALSMLLFRLARHVPVFVILAFPLLANCVLIARALYSPWTYSWLVDNVGDNFIFTLLLRVIDA